MTNLTITGPLVPVLYDLREAFRAYAEKTPEGVKDAVRAHSQVSSALARAGFAIRGGDTKAARETMLEVAALAVAYAIEVPDGSNP